MLDFNMLHRVLPEKSIMAGGWDHWGCLSQKQKGARAGWQLVYEIYLPAIDTIVTGMVETTRFRLLSLQQVTSLSPSSEAEVLA